MAKVFKFQDNNSVELDINGSIFNIDPTDILFLKNLKEFGNILKSTGENLPKFKNIGNIDDIDLDKIQEQNIKVMESISNGIDLLLGVGSTNKIFNGTIVNLDKLTQVSMFIVKEINEHKVNKNINKYINRD